MHSNISQNDRDIQESFKEMLELYQLEQLVMIEKCGTFSEAARELYISQPALSRSMQRLEKELGFPLFEHGKNRVSLTPTGVLAVSYARELLKRAKEMQTQLIPAEVIGRILSLPMQFASLFGTAVDLSALESLPVTNIRDDSSSWQMCWV